MSRDITDSVKGIFIILVFFSHFNSYADFTWKPDLIYNNIISLFSQTMVTMFLFYSGYGVMESIKNKKKHYVDLMPRKRLLTTIINFDIAVCIFLILAICFNEPLTVPQVLLSLIGWDSVGNSNWYIFVILLLYLITYIIFKIVGVDKPIISVITITSVVCILILVCALWKIKPLYWYDTALCYCLGMFYSIVRERFDRILNRNVGIWLVALCFSFCTFIALRLFTNSSVFVLVQNIIFAAVVLIITMRVSPNNKLLRWCGNNLFGLYILQRIPMIVFSKIGLAEWNLYIYFVCCVAVTVVIVIPFNKLTNIISKKLT